MCNNVFGIYPGFTAGADGVLRRLGFIPELAFRKIVAGVRCITCNKVITRSEEALVTYDPRLNVTEVYFGYNILHEIEKHCGHNCELRVLNIGVKVQEPGGLEAKVQQQQLIEKIREIYDILSYVEYSMWYLRHELQQLMSRIERQYQNIQQCVKKLREILNQ